MISNGHRSLLVLQGRAVAVKDVPITNAAKKISSVGGSLRDVQMLAGHSSLAVTQRYIEGDGEARVKVVDLV